ncbi:MAG: PBP1A family penicillin-binding protein [Actinomycetota bacterium]|nr:PBP1A family penicillin-binding protein [Actinomycetota bacterium]
MAFASFGFGLVTAIAGQIPALDPARQQSIARDGFIYSANNHRILARLVGRESRLIVPSGEISPLIKQAIVAIEDKRFYEHRGIDIRGMGRALWADIRGRALVQGGSTITQQFIKNTYTKNQRSVARKLKEAALAWQLEQRWSKDRILTAYLNTIYFGNDAYGVETAAQTYFQHSAKRGKLDLAESALLAGIPANPTRYDPVSSPRLARERRNQVLREMFRQGDITEYNYVYARGAPMPRPQDVRPPGAEGPAQYFSNYVKQQLVDRYGSGRVYGGGLRVYTTIDLKLQRMARNSIAKWLGDPNGPSAALVAVDPRDGRVLTMFGGSNFRKSQFNLAVQGERQPGSSFKPFVLATALKNGVSPQTTFTSKQIDIDAGGRVWQVNNYEGSYLGPISLATATTVSDNSVYAQLTKLVGPLNVVRTAKQLGIRSPLRGYFSIGLGAQAVNPLEMARAFGAFANGGRRVDGASFGNRPRVILKVENSRNGAVDDNQPVARQVLTADNAAIVTTLLQDVVRSGTGRQANLPDGRPVAGKTGTTENYGDAWFVGYTPQLAVAVWVGYPTRLQPMLTEYHGKSVAGGTYPALIWKSFMETALPYLGDEPQSFPSVSIPYGTPKAVVFRDGRLQLDNGNCRDVYEILFFGSAGPTNTADCKPNEVEVPNVVGNTLAVARHRLDRQPLTPTLVYRPARARQRPDIVVGQYPSRGTLSSYDKVTLVLPKPLHGLVPRLVGLSLDRAKFLLDGMKLKVRVDPEDASGDARVIWQSPRPGVAAEPGMKIMLAVKRG